MDIFQPDLKKVISLISDFFRNMLCTVICSLAALQRAILALVFIFFGSFKIKHEITREKQKYKKKKNQALLKDMLVKMLCVRFTSRKRQLF